MNAIRSCRRAWGHTVPSGQVAVRTWMSRIATLVLAVMLVSATEAGAPRHVNVQAHRGFSHTYPENTLLSLDRAFAAGADVVEADLALTADDQVILMHDVTVDRTTDGSGPVESLTLEVIRQLDAGGWKDARFAGEPVPTLREAIRAAEGRGTLNLEVKSRGRLWSSVQRLIVEAVRIVEEEGARDRVLFSSFEVRTLLEIREHDPEVRLFLIDWDAPSQFDNLFLAIHHGFDGWLVHPDFATEDRIVRAKEGGLYVHVSRTSEAQMRRHIEWGADQLGTNEPPSLIAWLEREGYRKTGAEAP